jgi:hypothetical protein
MNQGFKLLLYPVKDIARAKRLYRKLLGIEPYTDEAYYVGFRVGDLEIGLDPNGHNKGMTGPVGRRHKEEFAVTPRRWWTSTARGPRCRWG